MDHNHLSNQSPNTSENPWSILESPNNSESSADHILSAEELKQFASDYRAEQIAKAPERVNFFATNIHDTEIAFGSQLDRISSRGESHISAKEYEFWENDFTSDWNQIQKQVSLGNLGSSQEAAAESPMFTAIDPARTIEANAGHFFDDRKNALLRAIRSSNSDTVEQDLQAIRDFPSLVGIHLDYRYMSTDKAAEYYGNSYDRLRTEAHNNVIDSLNHLNDLARKYGTSPLTPRNFWNSRNSRSTDPEETKNRMRHDRHIVEEYCTYAFTDEIARHERNNS